MTALPLGEADAALSFGNHIDFGILGGEIEALRDGPIRNHLSGLPWIGGYSADRILCAWSTLLRVMHSHCVMRTLQLIAEVAHGRRRIGRFRPRP